MNLWPSEERRAAFIAYLRLNGVSKIVANFSGGGDCGEIESPEFFNAAGEHINLTDTMLDWVERQSRWDDTHTSWQEYTSYAKKSVSYIAHDIVNQLVDSSGLDWYNNEGGQGCVVIDFLSSPPKVTVEMGINVTTVDEHEFDYTEDFFGELNTEED
jgi:hypothetical protein